MLKEQAEHKEAMTLLIQQRNEELVESQRVMEDLRKQLR